MKPYFSLFWLLSLFFLAGCAVETAHAPENESQATPTVTATPTLASNTAVIFKRSGGIAGLNEAWTIFTDGRVETNSPTQPNLSAEEVAQLLENLASSGFFELNSSYLPEDTCCDRFLYELTAVQDNTIHTVKTIEATPDMPEALQQALRLVQAALFEGMNE